MSLALGVSFDSANNLSVLKVKMVFMHAPMATVGTRMKSILLSSNLHQIYAIISTYLSIMRSAQ